MICRNFLLVSLAFILITLFLPDEALTQRTKSSLSAGNQRHSEKSLKDDTYFFYFINPTVTNSGSTEEISLFKEAARRDIIARMLFMKFSFDPAMSEIRKVQQLLITLFIKISLREIENARELLNSNAGEILRSGDKIAKKYMALGYRSVDTAEKVMVMSDNLKETNYSIRLYEYVKAIKSAKYAKRYAIIALIENRIPAEKKIKVNYNSYKKVQDMIDLYIPNEKEKYQNIHFDNYYKYEPSHSIYDSIISNPELEKIPEYENYRKEH